MSERRRPLEVRVAAQYALAMPRQHLAPRETRALYRAILLLRRCGFPVYRAGRDHRVAGGRYSTRELFRLARTVRDAAVYLRAP